MTYRQSNIGRIFRYSSTAVGNYQEVTTKTVGPSYYFETVVAGPNERKMRLTFFLSNNFTKSGWIGQNYISEHIKRPPGVKQLQCMQGITSPGYGRLTCMQFWLRLTVVVTVLLLLIEIYLQDLTLLHHLITGALTIDCHMCSPTEELQHPGIFPWFHLVRLWSKRWPKTETSLTSTVSSATASSGLLAHASSLHNTLKHSVTSSAWQGHRQIQLP